MNLSHLYYFRRLAELQHYTQAAQELYITQPSLSGAISCLEAELGIALFQKRGRNVVLTKYGKVFYDYVCNALRELDTGIAISRENAGELDGTIDISCISTIQGDYLPTVIRDFNSRKGSHVKFNIYQNQTNAIIDGIKSGKYDIGFCSMVERERELYFVPILSQKLVAVVGGNHPLSGSESLCFADLQEYPLISYQSEQPIGRAVRDLLKLHRLSADHRYSDEVTMSGMAIIHPVVAIILNTPSLRQFSKLDLTIIPLPEVPNDFRIVHMAFVRNSYKNRAVENFIDYVTAFRSYSPASVQDSKRALTSAN